MIAYEGAPQIVEKEKALILSSIIYRTKMELGLGKERVFRSFRLSYCHVYPQIIMVALEVSIMALFS